MNDATAAGSQKSKSGLRRTGSTRILSENSPTDSTGDIRTRLRNRPAPKSGEARSSNLMNAAQRRTRFYRRSKGRMGNLKEVSEEQEEDEEQEGHEIEEGQEDDDENEEHEEDEEQEEYQTDDTAGEDAAPRSARRRTARRSRSSGRIHARPQPHSGPLTRSASLRSVNSVHSPAANTIRRRLRSSKNLALEEEEEDGDDEGDEEDGRSEIDASQADEEEVQESVEAATSEEEEEEAGSENEQPSIIELSDDEAEESQDIIEVDRYGNPIHTDSEVDGAQTEASETGDDQDTETAEADAMDEDEGEDGDYVDLADATVKSLTRMKRDDLVQLCEAREIDISGTKPQLAHALLEWRDSHAEDDSSSCISIPDSASSGSTARPNTPKTRRTRGNGNARHPVRNGVPETPILLRSSHIHVEQPATPPMSHGMTPVINVQTATPQPEHQTEPELDLDLEELGLEEKEIPPEKLTKLEKIGSGGFKDVFVGKYRGRKVALAEIRGQLTQMDIKELTLLRDFDHPNIVRFLGVSVPENTRETPVMIISELCANGDLYDYIRNVPPPPLKKVIGIMLDIASGLRYLHELKPAVIHRDCKSSNILITTAVHAKIADFGLAKVKQSTRSMIRSVVGTVNWQAPELWHPHPKYDYKVDVFSCAMVFWEILQWHNPNKKYPWEGMNEHAIYEAVGQKRLRPSTSGLRKQWTPALVDLVEQMWAPDPHDRPSMAEVYNALHRILSEL
ncbi:kinase-like protein [Dacryopinax primogenitus]|uniref:Kinase-like protein n=1 Tax=Dacryopinax primogenitus (strain DJM 731) TaxID=1858805 RepID=M5G4X7_DACPD|nr:kinase-like protein [Dacryopinax primogenitus]EJU05321.1 kinase-like protein [Dacryopinax primogenitus]